ncbi:beta-galactosidase [Streptomyces boninensis]|uniref:beta-galactosidase n=1 Tax=Streptomyces boninensis TaxID=2039455 RepID=UPI003B219492
MPGGFAPRPPSGQRIFFGGDYNPEQWPEDTWPEDIELMRAAGVNSATVGVFSWSRLEPRPGRYDFGWLDRLLGLLHDGGVGGILATPTAAPPPWLGARHPESLPRDEHGQTVWYGSRQHFCASSRAYRTYAGAITERLADRYGDHPAVRMWHVNNEYCTFCYCDATARHFRRWLRSRYGELPALNDAWGTAFWSQAYSSWNEILPPRRTQYLKNPTQMLDFRRFTSDALLECFTAERDLIRARTRAPVTTNFMPMWVGQDAWRWAAEEDVVSVDVYPDPADPLGGQYNALIADMTRGQAGGAPWMVMEQAAGPVNFRGVNHPKPRGLNRLLSWQTVARGADAVCFFQWRQSRQGAEKFHSGMVSHAGPEGRTYQEVKQLGAELARLGPRVAGSRVDPAPVAIVHDWQSWWAGLQDGRPSDRVHYPDVLRAWHRALWEAGLQADFVQPGTELTPYRLAVVPQLYAMTDAAIDTLRIFALAGGHVAAGFLTGIADADDRIREGGMDGRLRDLFGIRVLHEWWPLDEGEHAATDAFDCELWTEELEPVSGAEIVTAYAGGELDGLPAVLRNGRAWYVSTLPRPAALRDLCARIAAEAGVRPVLAELPAGVEAVRRGDLLFVLNHGRDPVSVDLPDGRHHELLDDVTLSGPLKLGRYGVAVLHPTPHKKKET